VADGALLVDERAAAPPDVEALVRSAERLAAAAGRADGWTEHQRRTALGALERIVALVTAARSRILVAERAADRWSGSGDRSFEQWHARTSHTGARAASHQVRQAETLASLPRVAEAVVTGGMSTPHLDVIARAATTGSDAVAERIRSAEGQAQLVAMAGTLDADAYGKAVARWTAQVDPARLERSHQEQRAHRFLHVTDTPGGTHVKGLLDRVAGHRLLLALEAATPRPAADDERTSEQRRADALAAVADTVLALPETTPGAAVRPHVSVVLREETWVALRAARRTAGSGAGGPAAPRPDDAPGPSRLLGQAPHTAHGPQDAPQPAGRPECAGSSEVVALRGVRPPSDEDGNPVPASEIARILCDCELTRVVVDAQDLPVDLGRTARLYSGAQRRAVLVRDGGCGWPGCGARARWCEVHHIAWWDRDDGPTSIDNAIALCSFHHHEVHRQDLRISRQTLGPPGDPSRPVSRGTPRRGATRASDPTGPPGYRYAFSRPDGRVVAPVPIDGGFGRAPSG